ncbi:hypothetical protein JVU11DRAFT_8752 [Chiua virens]|nr:hypothetical protein JVU11DRAFT_8752 [Chiua virens]
MSRKRSSSPAVFERTGSKSNANAGTTPTSPTSPTSTVITDWTQFSLSGFGDAPTTQPLVALPEPDDDVEITQPRLSRKSSRQRGKSRSRRRRSEDREPSDNSPSSQPDHASSTIETKLASVHVVQIDEAFIDFWSDAIVDPISTNWPTFVVCGLKQIPNVNQSIRWLIIEQTYSRQQPKNSRVPSPDGQRGRSPRPSFKSDMSGFRINSVLSSARKRFSVFSKSATDLELKKSGGKILVAGELGEVLVEEEIVRSSVAGTAGAPQVAIVPTTDVAQLKVNEIDATPIVGTTLVELALTPKEESNAIHVAAEVPSVEPSAPEEGVPVEQCAPRTLDGVTQGVNSATDLVAKMTPLTAEVPNSLATQDTNDPTVPVSVPTAENPLAVGPQTNAEPVRQDDIVEGQHQLAKSIVHPRDGDELTAESSSEPSTVVQVDVADVDSQGNAEAVAGLSAPAAVAVPTIPIAQPPVLAAVDDKIPEPADDESHVAGQASRNAPADLLAGSTTESVTQQKIDDLPLIPATDMQGQNLVVEMPAQLEDAIICAVDEPEEAEEVAEQVEIPTPIPERVVLVEETPGLEASDDVNRLACVAHVPASENKPLEDADARYVATELQTPLGEEAPSVRFPVETSTLGITAVTDTTTQIFAIDTEHAVTECLSWQPKKLNLVRKTSLLSSQRTLQLKSKSMIPWRMR